jgi:sarcosine/dimethylglycine N-methyltransferase
MSESYWRRPRLGEAILEALGATGQNAPAPSIDDLARFDHFHGGGIAATRRLARAADPAPGSRVLDIGGGLGGPARLLAVEHGCDVTVLDLTEDYVRAGQMLTALLHLEDRVRLRQGDALDLPFPDDTFDLVWTQNSGMNIADKERLYRGIRRVLRPGGRLATQEPVAGPVQPPHFPLMWARDAAGSFLLTAGALRALIQASGFSERVWEEVTSPPPQTAAVEPNIQTLAMGDRLPAIQASNTRNWAERRLASITGVFTRE